MRCGGGIGAEECGERCAAEGQFLSRNKGKAGEDACIAIGEMAQRCAGVGALVRRSVGKAALVWGHWRRGVWGKVRWSVGIGAEECGERCAAVGRFLIRNKGKAGEDACTAIGEMARGCEGNRAEGI